MSDNVALTPGVGVSVATDDVGGVQFQKVKLDVGADGLSVPVSGALPVTLDGTDVFARASTGANTQITITMPAVVGKTNYLAGWEIKGLGATAAGSITATFSGLLGGVDHFFPLGIPAGVLVDVFWHADYTRPIPASGTNTAIVLVIPGFGAGVTFVEAILHGYYK